jgi:hypothetical protein
VAHLRSDVQRRCAFRGYWCRGNISLGLQQLGNYCRVIPFNCCHQRSPPFGVIRAKIEPNSSVNLPSAALCRQHRHGSLKVAAAGSLDQSTHDRLCFTHGTFQLPTFLPEKNSILLLADDE